LAKQEPPDGKQDGNSESSPKPSPAKPPASPSPANSTSQDKDKAQPVPPEDVQLLKAVEMLKSWKVFKQLKPAA
jgi:carboxyl-terminal processing protease